MASPAKSTPRLVRHLPLTKVRINLGDVIKRVRINKEYVILEKDGLPVAGLMDIDEFEDYLELHDPKARADIEKSSAEHRAGKSRTARALLEALRREARGSKRTRRRRSA